MQIEAHSPVRHTVSVSVPDTVTPLDPSSGSYDSPRWLSNGRESLASSSDLARYLYFEGPTSDASGAFWSTELFPRLVDGTCFLQAEPSAREDVERGRVMFKLYAAFDTEPLEDGMYHPAEAIIREALGLEEDQQTLEWLRAFSLDTADPSFAASVLRCLGRQRDPGTDSWRAGLVRDGLAVDDVEIRDAAVQAAEWWGSAELGTVLKSHSEPVAWLREYIQDVIDDLEER